MARAAVPLAALAAAALLGGCATTHVATSDPKARIWFDGRVVKPDGYVWSMGPPRTAHVVVVAPDGRHARALVSREFSWLTLVHGVRTLGICFVLCWNYPHEVYVPLPPPRPELGWDAAPGEDPWEQPADDPWARPPGSPAAAGAPRPPRPRTFDDPPAAAPPSGVRP